MTVDRSSSERGVGLERVNSKSEGAVWFCMMNYSAALVKSYGARVIEHRFRCLLDFLGRSFACNVDAIGANSGTVRNFRNDSMRGAYALCLLAVVTSLLFAHSTSAEVPESPDVMLLNAVKSLDIEATKTALGLGARVSSKDDASEDPLMALLWLSPKGPDQALQIAEILISAGARVRENRALWIPISIGNVALVELLLDSGASATEEFLDMTPLAWAIQSDQPAVSEVLLSRGAPKPTASESLQIDLIKAIEIGDLNLVRHLLAKGALVNGPRIDGRTPLVTALATSRIPLQPALEIALLLMSEGADPNIESYTSHNIPSLPLQIAALWPGDYAAQILPVLLVEANTEARDSVGRTALHLASESDNLEGARLLLQAHARPMAMDGRRNTPLDYAVSEQMKSLLQQYGAKKLEWRPGAKKVAMATLERASALAQQGDYLAVIEILDPIFENGYSTAYRHFEGHRRLKKLGDYINKAKPFAEAGYPDVAYFVALALSDQQGVEGNPHTVTRYLQTAHNGGIAMATETLGAIYRYGYEGNYAYQNRRKRLEAKGVQLISSRNVPSDLRESAKYFSQCAQDEDDMIGLGCIEALGHLSLEMTPPRPKRAIKYFEQAKAFGTLWSLFYFGIEVPEDRVAAKRYRDLAAQLLEEDPNFMGQTSCFLTVIDSATKFAGGEPDAMQEIGYAFGSGLEARLRVPTAPSCFPDRFDLHMSILESAAELNSSFAAGHVADHYSRGKGVPKDLVLAHYFASIESANSGGQRSQEASLKLSLLEDQMTDSEIGDARERFQARDKPSNKAAKFPGTFGTAFTVTKDGRMITNNHVVRDCAAIDIICRGDTYSASVLRRDSQNDLALLQASATCGPPVEFRIGPIQLGERVVTAGFPLPGFSADSVTVTDGIISNLAGPGNDSRFVQFTAPIQPGNSGGPLVDRDGKVVGIVTATIDAVVVAQETGTIPQNTNFAIRSAVGLMFLAGEVGVNQQQLNLGGREDAASNATKSVARVRCAN